MSDAINTNGEEKCLNFVSVKRLEVLATALAILCIIPLVCNFAGCLLEAIGYSSKFSNLPFFFCTKPYFFYSAMISITTLLGFLLLSREELLNPDKDNGPVVRRALVATMVVAYLSFFAAILWQSFESQASLKKEQVDLFKGIGAMVTIIMGFYFGTSALTTISEKRQLMNKNQSSSVQVQDNQLQS